MSVYPGDDVMQAWWNDSPFYYTGFYLGPAPCHPDASFMDKRQVLINQGWGLLPVFVGHQANYRYLSYKAGAGDADTAAVLMARAGFPQNSVVFLDIETSHTVNDRYLSYISGWVNEIQNQGYTAGIYCNTVNAWQLMNALPGGVRSGRPITSATTCHRPFPARPIAECLSPRPGSLPATAISSMVESRWMLISIRPTIPIPRRRL